MKKLVAALLLSLPVALAGCSHPRPVAYYPPPPPPGPGAIFQQGQMDGANAARNDIASGRPPRFNRHPRYRNPPVPPPAIGDYRNGFRSGYEGYLQSAPPPQ